LTSYDRTRRGCAAERAHGVLGTRRRTVRLELECDGAGRSDPEVRVERRRQSLRVDLAGRVAADLTLVDREVEVALLGTGHAGHRCGAVEVGVPGAVELLERVGSQRVALGQFFAV